MTDDNDTMPKKALKGLGRLAYGAAFVVATIVVWRVFMVATWWAGRDLIWTPPVDCTPLASSGPARVWDLLLGYDECAALHWAFGLLLMVLAAWTTMRAFFPPRYPPERYPLPRDAPKGAE